MKKAFTKFIVLSAMLLLAVSSAFAQGKGGSNYPDIVTDPDKGPDWELVTYGGKTYSYFRGNQMIDTIKSSQRKMLGFHWKGHDVSEIEADTFYLCNVATGEYLQVGEYWGQTGMINHVGLAYKLVKGYYQRKQQAAVFPNWPEETGYFLQPIGVKEGKVMGRMNRNDGQLGHFEYNKFFALRDMDEYDDGFRFDPTTNTWVGDSPSGNAGWGDDSIDPGGFLFQFYPVDGEDDEQEYVIYTHRRTDIYENRNNRYNIFNPGSLQFKLRSEYYDRDSYLMLTNAGPMTADYNSVRFVKFAGDMGSPTDTDKPQLGDEIGKSGIISLDQGLTDVAADPNNRWKIVTKKERDAFRLVASEKQPLDATSRIFNPKFYTSFIYNWAANDCTGPDAEGHYTHPNEDTEFGWQWFDRDTETHPSGHHHVHPYDIDYSGHWDNKPEHHKVGTGHFWRTGTDGINADKQEHRLTYGQEANYCASIFKGSANIQQEIKGLREGLYAVFVRGFYAPHDMTKYTIDNWNDRSGDKLNGNSIDTAPPDWQNEAYFTEGGEKLWHRSHDSYLFAWSTPVSGEEAKEVRRMLPSIYEGAIRMQHLGKISRSDYMESEDFKYTMLGNFHVNQVDANGDPLNDATIEKRIGLMMDKNVFARYRSSTFGNSGDLNWIVPKTITGAGRFFNAVDEDDATAAGASHKNAGNYRIGLPVYVGSDGKLVIGVDHTQAAESNSDEWVCFDDFELIYLGKVEPDEFVIDELEGTREIGPFQKVNGESGEIVPGEFYDKKLMKNNTQWIDLFSPNDIANDGLDTKKVKTVVLRRTMPKGWSSIVLPVSLTKKHVKEMFGENANVSRLNDFVGRTIMYEDQMTGKGETDIVIQAGIPYIVRPSREPIIPENSDFKYERPAFTKAYSTTPQGVAGWFLKDEERNAEVERELAGPIWVATEVEITSSESFPDIEQNGDNITGNGAIWTNIEPFEKGNLVVRGKSELGKFRMKEYAVYEPGGQIPANSYYWANGKMYYTTTAIPKTGGLPRGLYSYLQMIQEDTDVAYAKQFIDGSGDYFIEVIDEPTGIEDINRPLPDGKIEIYDLQGRKVTNPGRGIYIMNGQKVLFK